MLAGGITRLSAMGVSGTVRVFTPKTALIGIIITDDDVSIFALSESGNVLINLTEKDDARFNITESGDALL